jgi:hypothetical protein
LNPKRRVVLVLAVVALLAVPSPASALKFTKSSQSPIAAANPNTVATADFDEDGKDDLAIATSGDFNGADYAGGGATILLGSSTGTLSPAAATPLLAGQNVRYLETGLVNNDAHADLIAGTSAGTWTAFLGNGSGGFAAQTPFALEAAYTSNGTALGDVDGDGDPDLVTSAINYYSVALNNGSGGFTATAGSPVSTDPVSGEGNDELNNVAIGDFDKNGKADLAFPRQGLPGDPEYLIAKGNGDGTFATVSRTTVADLTKSLQAADLNGDEYSDLVLFQPFGQRSLLGNASAPPLTPTGTDIASDYGYPVDSTLADMNNDGKLDTISTGFTNHSANVALGNGLGGFSLAPGSPYAMGDNGNMEGITVGDFNGDGAKDIAGSNQYGDDSVSILISTPEPKPAKLTLKLTGTKAASNGSKLKLTATTKNIGETDARALKLKTIVPKRLAKPPKAISAGTLAAGKKTKLHIKVRLKPAAAGKKVTVNVKASAKGVKTVAAKVRVKIPN